MNQNNAHEIFSIGSYRPNVRRLYFYRQSFDLLDSKVLCTKALNLINYTLPDRIIIILWYFLH